MKNFSLQRSEDLNLLYTKKHKNLLSLFLPITDPQKTYEKIIQLGKSVAPPQEDIKKEEFLIEGCQSISYLSSQLQSNGNIFYQVHSEALISLGLASLLLSIYQDEPIQLILLYPPLFIQELGLNTSLSPGRSNGLASMYAKMKNDALALIIKANK